jgi:carboxypeptidase C (cathepsin A)
LRPGLIVRIPVRRYRYLIPAFLAVTLAFGAHAQDAAEPAQPQSAAAPSGQKGPGKRDSNTANPPAAVELHKLPPDSTTKQTVALPGRSLAFTATAGSIRLFNDKGEPQADIAYIAYQLDGADARTRPVTFLFNGGPGASSAWLQFGAVGPWRLPINADEVTSSTAPDLQPNAETWLDFSDLVSIPSAPATAASSRQATTCANGFTRLTATSNRSQS